MGVRKAQEAPIATAISNGSAETSIPLATLIAIGAANIAAAALLMIFDSNIVATIKMIIVAAGGADSATFNKKLAINSEPPVVSKACPTGSIAASKTMTGKSRL